MEEPLIVRLALIVPGLSLARRHAVRRFVARRSEGRHVDEQTAPAFAQVVDLAGFEATVVDALDGLDWMEFVPAPVAGVVDPAPGRHDEVAEVQFAAAVPDARIVDIAVA